MATVTPSVGTPANICTNQTGNAVSTNVADRGAISGGACALRIVTTVGSTPTCTYLVEGSADGTNFVPAPYADPTTPETVSVATFAVTSATTTIKYLRANSPWRYLRVTLSSNTNVTSTIDLLL